ncbi:Isotrichodermin C-15 hydroxylase [Sphaceloma murrayae]|uniref:Isotrichodermin C-15 hydroxylase n=1 Tax=Sphaceloma murrayae TaxID=2082308 RepID=A0A2K1QIV9_9PEZI|nr:Isotrichodermin C-15 hydroxylase [Sphaceloma murrayae]
MSSLNWTTILGNSTSGKATFVRGQTIDINQSSYSLLVPWLYYLSAPLATTALWGLWNYVFRLLLLRRWYEKQGISFVNECYAVVGAEIRVTGLQQENKSHDWLYKDKTSELYGTLRGLTLQLYTTNAQLCGELVRKTGRHVDRDTPALHSVGRLSPSAIPFQSMHKLRFRDRKGTLTKGVNDNKRLFEIVERQAHSLLDENKANSSAEKPIDVRAMLEQWTRKTSGEFVWGQANIARRLTIEETDGVFRELPFMTVLNQTFTELRFYSSKFWNRVWFPLAGMPLTHEARRLNRNIAILRSICTDMMNNPEPGTVAAIVQDMNDSLGLDKVFTLDDLITATFAGLDAVKSTVMGCLYHMLNPAHSHWRQALLDELDNLDTQPGPMDVKLMNAPILNAFVYESLRFEPPGSLINNAAVEDFDLAHRGKIYKIKAGTRIVTSIHALHQNEASWREVAPDMSPLSVFDPNRFLDYGERLIGSSCFMPFGKGPRRCPGQAQGALMVKGFLKVFLQSTGRCRIVIPEGQTEESSRFHVYSHATFGLVCEDKGEETLPESSE